MSEHHFGAVERDPRSGRVSRFTADGHIYTFNTNFASSIIIASRPQFRARHLNQVAAYKSLADAGVGLIPEIPVLDQWGMPSQALAFYRRDELEDAQVAETSNWLFFNYPQFFDTLSVAHAPTTLEDPLPREEIDKLVALAMQATGLDIAVASLGQSATS